MCKKNDWENFKNFKERGEWVELLFMAAAAQHGYHVLKPWGDSRAYDVGIELRGSLVRVQVKSTTNRVGAGYVCKFKPNIHNKSDYTLSEIDLFAAYVIPENVWYVIPAAVILGPKRRKSFMLCPIDHPTPDRCKYEHYREAWGLLAKTRHDLSRASKPR
jgi:hypothetical protein